MQRGLTKAGTPGCLIIPAAGLGKRMKSVKGDIPKEMLPIASRPAIEYAVEEGIGAGISQIIVIINRDKEVIRQHFTGSKTGKKFSNESKAFFDRINGLCRFTFFYQEMPSGEADAISLAATVAQNQPVAIIYPDNLHFPPNGALKKLITIHIETGDDIIALTDVSGSVAEASGNAGRVRLEPIAVGLYEIKEFLPKGPGKFIQRFPGELRAWGISMYGPHIFDCIERVRAQVKSSEEFTDFPFRQHILSERRILGCLLPGIVFDIGNPVGYELCCNKFKTMKTF